MKGYFQRDDLTTQAVIDGWFLTGDIGVLDAHGRLLLRGRERDEINKGGMKIYPSDIDAVVERFAQASDVCTFALDDAIYGQVRRHGGGPGRQQDDTMRALHDWMKAPSGRAQDAGALVVGGRDSAHLARQDQPRRSQGRLRRPSRRWICPPSWRGALTMSGDPRAAAARPAGSSCGASRRPACRSRASRTAMTAWWPPGLIDSLAILQIVTWLETTYGIDFAVRGIDPEDLATIGGILDVIAEATARSPS